MLLAGVLVAVAAAAGNAVGSALQRSASRHHDHASRWWEGLLALLRRPAWLGGIGAHVVGFALQAVALALAPITVVQPVLVVELPFTLLLGALALGTPLGRRAWLSVGVMAGGVALFLASLETDEGGPQTATTGGWLVGTAVVVVVLGILTVLGRAGRGRRRALWFGIAAGVMYGFNAALLAGLGPAYAQGLGGVLTAWQTYGVLVGGTVSFLYLQQALQAGDLIWAQPGITLANPVVAVTWGLTVFGERVALDLRLIGLVGGVLAIAAGTVGLSLVRNQIAGRARA
ncbi:DMT family transporter [Actinomycetospora corticicola]|uniref:Drug/metabolite transporter (DMT)-like permease n=1 Tax=Actinomycetospora corticicola TaxID=663602 RepID=A0A7Y9J470_9PSEU|nr:DMT family transporter [Actinomycetospora corticicola]NYD34735.1 drug/metabolite transporter (DMT)-like permease [Actinomycetospora corticicola]